MDTTVHILLALRLKLQTDGALGAWFHFLCKSVSVKHANDEAWISDPRPGLSQMDHADGTWIRSGFFLQWKRSGKNPPQITLLCFEASSVLKSRLYKLPFATVNESAARDPLSLFVIILDDLSRQLNLTVWDVSSVFGEVETVRRPYEVGRRELPLTIGRKH
jgi:hypothetical protein